MVARAADLKTADHCHCNGAPGSGVIEKAKPIADSKAVGLCCRETRLWVGMRQLVIMPGSREGTQSLVLCFGPFGLVLRTQLDFLDTSSSFRAQANRSVNISSMGGIRGWGIAVLCAALIAPILAVPSAGAASLPDFIPEIPVSDEPACDRLLDALIDLDRCTELEQRVAGLTSSAPATPVNATAAQEMLDASNPAVSQTDTAIAQSAIEPASLVIAIADCSDYTASAIFDDPTGDWDQDGQSNVSEFYQQLDPCTAQVAQAVDSPDDAGSTLGSLAVEAVDYEGAADADAPVDSTVVDDGVSPEAQAVATVTCPAYSVQDIFSDPSGDWDGDGISNIIEFDNLLDPCTYDGNVPSTLESASIPSTVNTDSENVCPAFSVADVQADPKR